VNDTKETSSINLGLMTRHEASFVIVSGMPFYFFFSRRRTFRAWDMHALILIFCRLHTIDTELTQCLYAILWDLHSGHRMASNTMQFSTGASSRGDKKTKKKKKLVKLRVTPFWIHFRCHRWTRSELIALIATNAKKNYSSLSHRYHSVWRLSIFYK